jgi:hypothetical protein
VTVSGRTSALSVAAAATTSVMCATDRLIDGLSRVAAATAASHDEKCACQRRQELSLHLDLSFR